MNALVKISATIVLGTTALMGGAAGMKADKPKPLDPVKSAKYVAAQGGLVVPPDNGNRLVVWDASGKSGVAVTEFTNIVCRSMPPIPFVVRSGQIDSCPYKAAKGVKCDKYPAVIVISDAGEDAPALSVFPEEAIACINYYKLTDGDDKVTMTRVKKELFRSLGFILGGYTVTRMPCVMDAIYSRDELDANPTVLLSPMRLVGINKAAGKLHLPIMRQTLYSTAVRQGWAPAPTNDVQKAIWDKIHALPQNPMKIEFDPKKGR